MNTQKFNIARIERDGDVIRVMVNKSADLAGNRNWICMATLKATDQIKSDAGWFSAKDCKDKEIMDAMGLH